MDINHLICFITVAQTLNFSEAARRNYVSQSTVSRYVSEIEKEFGVQLFTRSHRDVIITNEGKTLLPYAVEIVENFKKAKSVIKQIHDGGQGKITLGYDVTSLSFPKKCLQEFTKLYPEITIDLRKLDEVDRSFAIVGGEYDFCFMPRDMVPESSGIDSIITHYETLSVITSKNHKFNDRKSISIRELSGERLLLLSETVSPIVYMEIMDLFRTFHITPDIHNVYEDLVSLYISASSGMGISIVPQSVTEYTSKQQANILSIDDTDTGIAYVMAWGRGISNPAARLFMEIAEKYSAGDDNEFDL